MAFDALEKIQPSETLAEGRDKINLAIKRVNDGQFNTVEVANDLTVRGTLTAVEFVTQQTSFSTTADQFFELFVSEDEQDTPLDEGDRGIIFKYRDGIVKSGFFGWSRSGKFKFIPEGTLSTIGETQFAVFTGNKGTLDANIQASDVLNVQNFVPVLSNSFVGLATSDVITGQKTMSSLLLLNNSNQGTQANHALTASRVINATDGLLINGTGSQNLTADRTLSVDSTVVRTLDDDQTILGTKTFKKIIASDTIIGTSKFVEDGVYTLTNQNITGSKVFRRAALSDGIRFWPRNTGTSDWVITISTSDALSSNRTIILPNANVNLVSGTMVSTTVDQVIDSTKTFNKSILFSDSGTSKRGIQGTVGLNDFWFVGGRAVGENEGYAEISTGNNASEPVYAKQYLGSPLSTDVAFRTFVILSTDGNTIAPGTISLGVQASTTVHAVRADRSITAGTGLTGGGNLTANRTLSVDSTVVRTLDDNQTILGTKTFTGVLIASDTILGNITSADKLTTPRNINGIPFDGTQNITVSAAVDGIFYESLQIVTQNYTVPVGRNALVVGPIQLAEGITMQSSEGSNLVVI